MGRCGTRRPGVEGPGRRCGLAAAMVARHRSDHGGTRIGGDGHGSADEVVRGAGGVGLRAPALPCPGAAAHGPARHEHADADALDHQPFAAALPARGRARRAAQLSAILSGAGTPLRDGLAWRIFDDRGEGTRPAIVARSTEAEPRFTLPPGAYVATVTYGFASSAKRIVLGGQASSDTLRIAAGALRLSGPWATPRSRRIR